MPLNRLKRQKKPLEPRLRLQKFSYRMLPLRLPFPESSLR